MGAPYDLSQGDPDLASLWPSLSGLLRPASPQLWAWTLAQHGLQQGVSASQMGQGDSPSAALGSQPAGAPGQDDGTPAWMSQTPPH
ncbi:MAG TPA: hypothetical protein VIJ94_16120, partial [Caulobacteraceae bacterium]